ncbi:MAG: polysaccharide biosynthesis protein [Deltaproteobacteria bacterium]|nr:MAG: polysaccharide biosynthesis protein [Deltaproteobacteria bacterium]
MFEGVHGKEAILSHGAQPAGTPQPAQDIDGRQPEPVARLRSAEPVGSTILALLSSPRLRALRASLWSVFGYGAAQVLRLVSSVILTRLLFRETFGIMALVNAVLQGLLLFSDLGIGVMIVQSRRGQEPAFLDTAWTIQVIRGALLFLVAVAIAWPTSRLYGEPQLLWLVPMVGLNALISGFTSTSYFTLSRSLHQRRLVLLDLAAQAISFLVTVAWAVIHPSVWALMGGGTTLFALKVIGSHAWLPGHRNLLRWDADAAREVFKFGRWVLVSSVLTFCANRLDSLLLGGRLSMAELGTYSIASTLGRLPFELMTVVAGAVMFPVLAEAFRRSDGTLHRELFRFRAFLLAPALAACVLFAVAGDRIIALLYDPRYQEAGWMLRVLAAGQVAGMVGISSAAALYAVADSFSNMCLEGARAVLLVVGMAVGGHLFGKEGLVIGVAAVGPLVYPFWIVALRRRGLWQPALDFAALLAVAGAIGAGLLLRH